MVVAADNLDRQPLLVIVNQRQIPAQKFLVSNLCPSVRRLIFGEFAYNTFTKASEGVATFS